MSHYMPYLAEIGLLGAGLSPEKSNYIASFLVTLLRNDRVNERVSSLEMAGSFQYIRESTRLASEAERTFLMKKEKKFSKDAPLWVTEDPAHSLRRLHSTILPYYNEKIASILYAHEKADAQVMFQAEALSAMRNKQKIKEHFILDFLDDITRTMRLAIEDEIEVTHKVFKNIPCNIPLWVLPWPANGSISKLEEKE